MLGDALTSAPAIPEPFLLIVSVAIVAPFGAAISNAWVPR